MKTLTKLFLLLILTLTIHPVFSVKHFVNYNKTGGLLNYFNTVRQTFDGFDTEGNEYYSMDCFGLGSNRCKFRLHGMVNGGGANPNIDPVMEFAASKISQLEDDVDVLIDAGQSSGSKTKNIVRLYQGNSTLVTIVMTWETDSNGDITQMLVVNEIPYPL